MNAFSIFLIVEEKCLSKYVLDTKELVLQTETDTILRKIKYWKITIQVFSNDPKIRRQSLYLRLIVKSFQQPAWNYACAQDLKTYKTQFHSSLLKLKITLILKEKDDKNKKLSFDTQY